MVGWRVVRVISWVAYSVLSTSRSMNINRGLLHLVGPL
jgi:hypothetical protein